MTNLINTDRYADKSIYNHLQFYEEPKEYFKLVIDLILKNYIIPGSLLDIGCANGSFLYHACRRLPQNTHFDGLEPVKELADIARNNVNARIWNVDLFSMAEKRYNIITMLGVLGCFSDLKEVLKKLELLLDDSGAIFIFSPFNEEKIDVVLNYRHAPDGVWQGGHNLFSMCSVETEAKNFGFVIEWINFEMPFPIPKSEDPMRSWTEPFRGVKNCLIYGTNMFSTMKLLILKKIK